MNPDRWIDDVLRRSTVTETEKHPESAELAAYVAGALSASAQDKVLRHLEGCPECVREVHALAEIARLGEGEGPSAEEIDAGWRQFQEMLAASGEKEESGLVGGALPEAPGPGPVPGRRPLAAVAAFPAGGALQVWAAVATIAFLGTLLLWRTERRDPPVDSPWVNVEVINLAPVDEGAQREARGPQGPADLAAPTRYVLILNVADPRTFPVYRVELVELASQRRIWESSGIERGRLGNFTLDLPAELVPAGSYRILLIGLGQSEPENLAEYRFQVAPR